MSEAVAQIIGIAISGVLAVIGSFVGNYAMSLRKSREDAIKEAEREQAQKDQLAMILDEQKKIKSRLDSHNGYAEKFADTTKDIAIIAERQQSLFKAMDRMQKDIDYLKSSRCKVQEAYDRYFIPR